MKKKSVDFFTSKHQFAFEENFLPTVAEFTFNDIVFLCRYGFNSDGHEAVYERVLAETQKRDRAIIGVNLGKNKLSVSAAEDYIAGVLKFGPIADYLVVNVSSPNTPGLRSLQKKSELQHLISQVMAARNSLQLNKLPPLLLKIAPDLSEEEKEDIASVILQDNVLSLNLMALFSRYKIVIIFSLYSAGSTVSLSATRPSAVPGRWRADTRTKLEA